MGREGEGEGREGRVVYGVTFSLRSNHTQTLSLSLFFTHKYIDNSLLFFISIFFSKNRLPLLSCLFDFECEMNVSILSFSVGDWGC